MKVIVTGSIATDHLMVFPGRFADSLMREQLESLSVSFLATDLQVRRGGSAANIAFGMARLGMSPVLAGAVGPDFDDYRSWLDRHGVDTQSVHVSDVHQTARFVCTTDQDSNQIATFYAGAMSDARLIEVAPIANRLNGVDLVLISPNDPVAMARHSQECREQGIAFAADPSQQLSSLDGDEIMQLLDGAALLFNNEYEAALIHERTGLTSAQVLERVPVRVTTLGSSGAMVETAHGTSVRVKCPQETNVSDPTGVGDAFRAGYVAGMSWGLGVERCAEVGSMLATLVIETVGTQEYDFTAADFGSRFTESYGATAAAQVVEHLRASREA